MHSILNANYFFFQHSRINIYFCLYHGRDMGILFRQFVPLPLGQQCKGRETRLISLPEFLTLIFPLLSWQVPISLHCHPSMHIINFYLQGSKNIRIQKWKKGLREQTCHWNLVPSIILMFLLLHTFMLKLSVRGSSTNSEHYRTFNLTGSS